MVYIHNHIMIVFSCLHASTLGTFHHYSKRQNVDYLIDIYGILIHVPVLASDQ